MTRFFIYILFFAAFGFASAQNDYLVIENVNNLEVLNKYQQEAKASDLAKIAPYVPMKIVERHGYFSDGIRSYMMVEIDGETFYLMTDDDAHLINRSRMGFLDIFRDQKEFSDRIKINKSGIINFFGPERKNRTALKTGETIKRKFGRGNRYYVSLNGKFGWTDLPSSGEGKSWQIYKGESVKPAVITDNLIMQVKEKTEKFNAKLSELFRFMNSRSDKELPVPEWEVETTENSVMIALKNYDVVKEDLRQSLQNMISEFETLALGLSVKTSFEDGVFRFSIPGAEK